MDRLRTERVVWTLDQRLYDLPRNSRIAMRREVRENLRTATVDVGATQAGGSGGPGTGADRRTPRSAG
jgi:hypothetical protein